ncbi:MAG: queuosine precursor transporter [Bacteroidota bacterium]
MKFTLQKKEVRLFIFLAGFFVTNALTAEFIGVKIFALEDTLGFSPLNWDLFGHQGSLMMSAGSLLWPVVFIMTDIINEYYGKRGIKLLSYFTALLISYAFFMVFGAIYLAPADFWVVDYASKGIPDMQAAFAFIFGQGMWIIVGSIVAFIFGQIIDAMVFHRLRIYTGEKKIWLRATGSTLVSQFIDTFVVLYIAFVLNPEQNWEMSRFLAVGVVGYTYKLLVAILLTPAVYFGHYLIDRYLGEELATKMKKRATLGHD